MTKNEKYDTVSRMMRAILDIAFEEQDECIDSNIAGALAHFDSVLRKIDPIRYVQELKE